MSDVLVKDGCMRPISPMNGRRYTLVELQGLVDGYIEVVDLGEKWLVFDEDGKVKGKLVNSIGTGWLRTVDAGGYLCGTVLLIGKERWG